MCGIRKGDRCSVDVQCYILDRLDDMRWRKRERYFQYVQRIRKYTCIIARRLRCKDVRRNRLDARHTLTLNTNDKCSVATLLTKKSVASIKLRLLSMNAHVSLAGDDIVWQCIYMSS